MIQLEKEALVLFKEYTHLQLKSFKIAFMEKSKGSISGAVEPYELEVLNKALDYHSIYINYKLNK